MKRPNDVYRAILLALAGSLALAASADAGPGGGAAPVAPPSVRTVSCVRGCPSLDAAAAGSVVRITGTGLARAREVVFLGARSSRDDVFAAAAKSSADRLDVSVPSGAQTGPVVVVGEYGQRSAPSRDSLTVIRSAGQRAPAAASGSALVDARVSAKTVFFAGRRPETLAYVLKTDKPEDVRVDLVRLPGHRSVVHWNLRSVSPGITHSIRWNGRTGRGVPPAGRYEFRFAIGAQPGVKAAAQRASRAASFAFLTDEFPIRGAHTFGDGGARFGAGRSGHTHQGQDVFARCGTPLVAERGGTVKWRSYQGSAGNYVVIDGAGTGTDTAYMHLRAPSLVQKGDHVYTGQPIGYVGDTGDATACHLHFEMWSAPGWYSGGSAFDPLASLKAWDRTS